MKASHPFHSVIALGLALSCTAALAGCAGAGSSLTPAATVNGTEVAEADVTTYIENFRASSSLQDDATWAQWLSDNSYTAETVRTEVVNYYVDQELLKQAAQERGITVDAAKVDEAVQSAKAGYESDEAWQEALKASNTSEEAYRAQVELSLIQSALQDSFESSEAPSDEAILEKAASYSGAKKSSCILFASDDKDTAQEALDRIESGEISFADAMEDYSEAAIEGSGDKGWDKLQTLSADYTDALADVEKDDVSDLVETEEGIYLIACTDEFTVPEEGLTEVSRVPEDLLAAVRSTLDTSGSSNGYNEWYADFKEKAEITINDMPEGVSYAVEPSAPTE